MNFSILLLSFCLLALANSLSGKQFDVIEVVNTAKNILDEGTLSYKTTRDISLVQYAAEKAKECPSKRSLESGEVLVKNGDLQNLLENLNATKFFSLDPFPTIAILHNKSARIHLDIGSRMGCAPLNCSDGFDQYCVFDGRKFASNRLDKYGCVKDKKFPNLCEEQPIDYFSMEPEEFQMTMMTWNNQRRAVAKSFNYSGMYELTWSDEAAQIAEVLGFACDPYFAGFLGSHYHMHPKTLDPLGSLWMITHKTIDGSLIHGNTTSQMFSQERKEFGCVPLDPTCCPNYSYICVLGPDWSSTSTPMFPSMGSPCGDCPDSCNDGLCVAPKKETNSGFTQSEASPEPLPKLESSKSVDLFWNDTGKVVALLFCFAGATGAALLLVYYILTNDYRS